MLSHPPVNAPDEELHNVSRVAGQRTQIGSFGCANPCVRSLELIERPRQLVAVGQMRCLKARDMPIGTMTTRAIVPRTVSIVSLAWKALRRQCRRATALVSAGRGVNAKCIAVR